MSTNVTVNGRPLEAHLSEEAVREIAEVRAADERPVPRRSHAITKRTRNHSGSRTAPGAVYRVNEHTTHLLIYGVPFPWQEKARYGLTVAGNSFEGVVEWDSIKNLVKCHACPAWVKDIPSHIVWESRGGSSTHTTARAYRERYGFRVFRTPLAIPETTAKRKAAGAANIKRHPHTSLAGRSVAKPRQVKRGYLLPERGNWRDACEKQTITLLQEYADKLGRTPTSKELNEYTRDVFPHHPISPERLRYVFPGISLTNILLRAGLTPNRPGLPRGRRIGPRKRKYIGPLLQNSNFYSAAAAAQQYRARKDANGLGVR